jgi:acyl dehydratase
MQIDLHSRKIGDVLASLTADPITRHILALYCGASGDHNPLHVDIDAARRYGADDVIAHGMLLMAYLGRLLTTIARPEKLCEFSVRFRAPVKVGDALFCTATLASPPTHDGLAHIDLLAQCQAGRPKATGRALIAL